MMRVPKAFLLFLAAIVVGPLVLHAETPPVSESPDFIAGRHKDDSHDWHLGPTGLRGWLFLTRSNLDRIQTDPTSNSAYGKVPMGPSRPAYAETPPLMKSELLGPVNILSPK